MQLHNRIFPHPRGADVWGHLVDLDGMTVDEAREAARDIGARCAAAKSRLPSPKGGTPDALFYAWHAAAQDGYWTAVRGR